MTVSADTLNYITNQIYIYGWGSAIILGLFGNIINIILFLTRLNDSVCTLYLLVAEIFNIVNILFYYIPTFIGFVYGHNGSESSVVWCRIIYYSYDAAGLISLAMLCLSSIDRYFCSSRQARRRELSSMKTAKISIIVAIFVCVVQAIPDLIYWRINSDLQFCQSSYTLFVYNSYFVFPFFWFVLPFPILVVFGYKTYKNLQAIQPSSQNTQKQRLENQLARMMIAQVICFLFQVVLPYPLNIYSTVTYDWSKSEMSAAIEYLLTSIAYVISSSFVSINFYLYYGTSKGFRDGVNGLFLKGFRTVKGVLSCEAH